MLKYASLPDVARLLSGTPGAHAPDATDALLRDVISAASRGERVQALDAFTRLANVDPARAEAFVLHPELAEIRSELDHLLNRFTLAARLEAETQIAHTAQLIPTSSGPNLKASIRPLTR